MAESGIGALAVSISADISDFVDGLQKADRELEKFGRKVDAKTREFMKFGAAAAAAGAAVLVFTKSAADMVDELGKASQKLGVGIEMLSGLKYAAELSNVSFDELQQGLRALSRTMAEAQSGAGDAALTFASLGIKVTDARGQLKDTDEMLLQLADQFSRMQDGAGKTALAMKIFGKSGAELIPFLNEGRKGINELRIEAERLGVVFSKEAAAKAAEFNDNLKRLETTARGLQVFIAGPMIEAINRSADAMLKAQKAGEGWLQTLITGFRMLTTGDDLHKWNKERVKAQDEEKVAFDQLLKARQAVKENDNIWTKDALKAAEQRWQAATQEIARLNKIKETLVGQLAIKEEDRRTGGGGGTTGGGAPPPSTNPDDLGIKGEPNLDFIDKDAEFWAKVNANRLAADKAFEEERLRIILEGIDRKQEAYEQSLRDEADARDQHERDLTAMGHTHRKLDFASAKTFAGNMALLMQTNSKKMFEIGKAAAIAETVINTYTMAVGAYKALSMIPIVGPALGAAAAGAAILYGMAQVQNIRAQSFGGGSVSSAAAPVFNANPATGAQAGSPGDVSRGPDTVIHLNGTFFSKDQVRDLINQINAEQRDGGKVTVAR